MSPLRKTLVKWVLIGSVMMLLIMLGISMLLNVALSLIEQQALVFQLSQHIDSAEPYFTAMRWSIVILLICYWKNMSEWYAAWQGLNREQRFFLQVLHPYVAANLLLFELFILMF